MEYTEVLPGISQRTHWQGWGRHPPSPFHLRTSALKPDGWSTNMPHLQGIRERMSLNKQKILLSLKHTRHTPIKLKENVKQTLDKSVKEKSNLLKMFTVIQWQRKNAASLKLILLQQQQIQLRQAPGPTAYIQQSCFHQLRGNTSNVSSENTY